MQTERYFFQKLSNLELLTTYRKSYMGFSKNNGIFNGMPSQTHLPHCRVLPSGEFNVMIPELRVTLQGASTGRIQWHNPQSRRLGYFDLYEMQSDLQQTGKKWETVDEFGKLVL